MIQNLLGRHPGGMILLCGFLTMVIPYLFWKMNTKVKQYIDPPWKKKS